MLENIVGLEDGKFYKFRNRADNSVIQFELGEDKMICGQEVPNGPNQSFEVKEERAGQFRVACKFSAADLQQFWDYRTHRKRLIHKQKSAGGLQLWASERVAGNETWFFIISVNNGFCLKGNGSEEQVTITAKDESDLSQQWRLEDAF